MTITEAQIDAQLEELRARQKKVEEAWRKTGNQGLLQFFVDIIPRLVDTERCSIFIDDPVHDSVWVHCGTGIAERQIEVPKGDSVVGEVVTSGKPVTRTGMKNKVGAHEKVDEMTSFSTQDTLCVPIFNTARDKVTGAIQVLNKKWGGAYTEADQALLEQFAFHLQANIENLFLRQEWGKFSILAREKIHELEEAKRRLKEGGA